MAPRKKAVVEPQIDEAPIVLDATELLDPEKPIAAYNPIKLAIEALRAKFSGVRYDVATTEGMKGAREALREIRSPRYRVEKIRKALKAPILDRGRRVDAEATEYETILLGLEAPIEAQITDEENRLQREADEAARLAQVERDRIAKLIQEIQFIPVYAAPKDLAGLRALLAEEELRVIDEATFGDQFTQARMFHNTALKLIRDGIVLREIEEQRFEEARVREEALKEEQRKVAEQDAANRIKEAELKRREEALKPAIEEAKPDPAKVVVIDGSTPGMFMRPGGRPTATIARPVASAPGVQRGFVSAPVTEAPAVDSGAMVDKAEAVASDPSLEEMVDVIAVHWDVSHVIAWNWLRRAMEAESGR